MSLSEEVSYSLFCAIRSISKKDLPLNKFASKETPLNKKKCLYFRFASIFYFRLASIFQQEILRVGKVTVVPSQHPNNPANHHRVTCDK
jgi:hypothetical protein